jgi:hypothetical protein
MNIVELAVPRASITEVDRSFLEASTGTVRVRPLGRTPSVVSGGLQTGAGTPRLVREMWGLDSHKEHWFTT